MAGKARRKKPAMHNQIRSALRKLFMWSSTRAQAMKQSNKICAVCKKEFLYKDLQVDHIDPVGATPGSRKATPDVTWDTFVNKMFCGVEGLQVVCLGCHNRKTHKKDA